MSALQSSWHMPLRSAPIELWVEPAFVRLRYSLEGVRPKQTNKDALSQNSIDCFW